MGKTIGLKQLSQKIYIDVPGLSHELRSTLGNLEDAFDVCIWGESGNGKSNFSVMLLKGLIQALNCKAEYISYEEGHGKSIRETMIVRHNMLEEVGNKLVITEHLSYEELLTRMSRKQSAKIWVIDSIQAAGFSYAQCRHLKEKFIMSRKKKIIIYISWAKGKEPWPGCAESIKYYANIKLHVDKLVVFPRSRYGGNAPFIIFERDAIIKWGKKKFNEIKKTIPPETKKEKDESLPAAVVESPPCDSAVGVADIKIITETN